MFKEAVSRIPDQLLDVCKVASLVDMWKNKHKIEASKTIDARLAADALYFKPEAKITVDSCISGAAFPSEIKKTLNKNTTFFTI